MIGNIMTKDYLNPPDLPNWSDTFSQVVVVQTGSTRTIYVSGQVAVNTDNNVVGLGDLGRQAEVALENLGWVSTSKTTDEITRRSSAIPCAARSRWDECQRAPGWAYRRLLSMTF